MSSQQSASPPEALIGRELDGRYRIEGTLGKGGMGVVYRATQLSVGRPVAVKLLTGQARGDADSVSRFRREANAIARLAHPNTVRIVDFGHDEATDHLYIAMELLIGESLRARLRARQTLLPSEVVHVARQVLKSLGEAHANAIYHRDLKPENIMLCRLHGESDFVKVVDFGIARVGHPSGPGTSITKTGKAPGTPRYMSPEQAMGEPVDGRSDLYSLAVIMYELLCGCAPFASPTAIGMMMHHMQTPPPPLIAASDLPEGLAALITGALSKDPSSRPQTAEAFLAALDAQPLPKPPQTDPDLYLSVDTLEPNTVPALGEEPVDPLGLTQGSTTASAGPVRGAPRRGAAWFVAALAVGAAAALGAVVVYDRVSRAEPSDSAETAAATKTVVPTPAQAIRPADQRPPPLPVRPPELATARHRRVLDSSPVATAPIAAPVVVATPRLPGLPRSASFQARARPRALIAPSRTLACRVETEPSGATVQVVGADRRRVGHAPVDVEWQLGADPPRVLVTRKGYVPVRLTLRSADAGRELRVPLVAARRTRPAAAPDKPPTGGFHKMK